MMTGIQNVNSLEAGYYAATLIFIGWFALYDFRRHLVRNQALAIFFFWCLLSLPLTASTSLLPEQILYRFYQESNSAFCSTQCNPCLYGHGYCSHTRQYI